MRATNRTTLSQADRVLAASRSYWGVCQPEFLGPKTVDGLPPITRLAARIQDLEDRGFVFELIGTRQKCRVYRLCSDTPQPERDRSPSSEQPSPTAKSLGGAAVALSSEEPEALFEVADGSKAHWRA